MSKAAPLQQLFLHLAEIARGHVADRGERWAAAVEAEEAAALIEQLVACADEAARTLQELADGQGGGDDQQLVNPILVERLRVLVDAAGGSPTS